MSRLVGELRRRHPGVVVHIEQPDDVTGVATQVRTGRAEVGLCELPIDEAGLVTEPLLVHELVVVVAPASPFAGRRRVTVRDLVGVPLVMTPPGTPMRRLIDDAFADVGATPSVAVETEQRDAIVPLVLAGAGASIVPAPLVEAARSSGAAAVSLSPRLRRLVGLVWRAGPMSPAATEFLQVSREITAGS